MSFAKIIIVGNLGSDPEVRYTPNGATTVSFSMAADGRPKQGGEKGTTWFRIQAWDRLAERLINLQEKGHLGKGKSLYVEGQFEQREYTDRNGQQRTSNDVTMTDYQFVGGGQQQQHAPVSRPYMGDDADEPASLDDIPF